MSKINEARLRLEDETLEELRTAIAEGRARLISCKSIPLHQQFLADPRERKATAKLVEVVLDGKMDDVVIGNGGL